jgi:tripartite-type tricarboxylate transporter receptor subunit TctC
MDGVHWRRAVLALVLTAAVVPASPGAAQDYPSRPVTLVVGFAPGGFADGVARLIGGKLSERLGQSVVIENRAGGGGNIAAALVAKAAPDGHTLLVTTTGIAINETISKDKGFALDDLKVVAIPAWAPETISVHPSSPAKTLPDLVQTARTKSISFASPGVGTSGHIANAYFFKVLARVDVVHVPFQGGAPAVNAVAGGHVDALVGAVPGYAGQLQAGLIRGLGVAAEQRLSQFPNIPTYGEGGFPELVAHTWVGLFAPAKTSDAILEKLNKAIEEIVRDPGAQGQFRAFHTETRWGDRADAAAYFRQNVEQWKKMITGIGLGGS